MRRLWTLNVPLGVTLSFPNLITDSTLSVRGGLKAESGPELLSDWFCVGEWWRW